jgi:chemotaxis protein histidine kinase CheA
MNPHGVTVAKFIPLTLDGAEEATVVNDEVDMELFPFFEEEAQSELTAIEAVLHAWDHEPGNAQLKDLRRQFHTLKGAANSIGHLRIGALAGGMKDALEDMPESHATPMRSQIIKTCIFVIGTVRALLKETRSPQFNAVKKEQVASTVQAIRRLQQMEEQLKGAA